MVQVVARAPRVFGLSPQKLEAKLDFLRGVGVAEDQLGQVGALPLHRGFPLWMLVWVSRATYRNVCMYVWHYYRP